MDMRFDATFILFIISLFSVALLHKLAMNTYLYWLYPWFDIPMHFLGGVVAGLGFLSWVGERTIPLRDRSFAVTIAFVFIVGISWELFEWYFDLVGAISYVSDTLGDLFFDLLGGTIAFFMVRAFRSVGM